LIRALIIIRDIHFASSVIVAGIIFFDLLIALPILQSNSRFQKSERSFREAAKKILLISLVLSIVSAFAWLCLLSMRISDKSFDEVVTDGTIWLVLTKTQFGFSWEMRLMSGVLLTACLLAQHKARIGGALVGLSILASLLASAYLGSLAFAGHGAEGLGTSGNIHLTADFLHLIAAGLWLGAIVPFVLLLTCLRRFREEGWELTIVAIGNRFSTLGILAVGILLVSGTINASFLLDGMATLIDTFYGRLLLLKISLFAIMLCLAGINRQYLLPRLRDEAWSGKNSRIVQQLLRNSLFEIALGGGIILIIGVLGVTAPANEIISHIH
jgi:putative copper resistance protein D